MNVVDLHADEWDEERHAHPAYGWKRRGLARPLGGERIGASVYERTWRYHFHHGNEEWLVALGGTATLRTPEGERELRAGEAVCFPEGPDGAHQVVNRSSEPARVLILSTLNVPGVSVYPDSDKASARTSPSEAFLFRLGDEVGYWEGE